MEHDDRPSMQMTTYGAERVVVELSGTIDRWVITSCAALLRAAVDGGARLIIVDLDSARRVPFTLAGTLDHIDHEVRALGGLLLVHGARPRLAAPQPGLTEAFAAYREAVAGDVDVEDARPELACA
ncbi:MAG: hypothetical protein ACT4O0_19300 [Pseudonocardia sp.]